MNYKEMQGIIGANANPQAWLHYDSKGIWTLKDDLNITIRELRGDSSQREFHQEWAKGFLDKSASLIEFHLYFGASFVETHYLVGVDENRALLPVPKPNTLIIHFYEYQFARCVDFHNRLDEYMAKCELTLEREKAPLIDPPPAAKRGFPVEISLKASLRERDRA